MVLCRYGPFVAFVIPFLATFFLVADSFFNPLFLADMLAFIFERETVSFC